MSARKRQTKPATSTMPRPAAESESVLEEVIDVSLQPDRAHHDELGHTREGAEEPASPREQAPVPLDVDLVNE